MSSAPRMPADPSSASGKGSRGGYRGPEKPKLLVVGEHLDREAEPFAGKSGVSFCTVMHDAAIEPAKCGFAWADEHLTEHLVELRPAWIVLSGDVALQAIRPDLDTRGMHGRPFSFSESVCYSTISHVALRRKPKRFRKLVLGELTALRRIARDPAGWMASVPDRCCHCSEEFHRIDDQGVVYCEYHWDWPQDPLEQLQRAFNATGDTGEPRTPSP